MKKKIKKLSPTEIKTLKDRYNTLKFNTPCELVYESQIPNTGIIVLDGNIGLLKKKKVQLTLEPGSMVGVRNIVQNDPSCVGCKILDNAELIMLNKSEILQALDEKDPELYAILKESL